MEQKSYLEGLESWEQSFGLIVGHTRMDDHVVSLVPVDRRRHFVLVTNLQRINDSDDLVEITPGLSWVGNSQTDDFLRVDDKDGSNGEWDTLRIYVGRVDGVQHIVKCGDFTIRVSDLS